MQINIEQETIVFIFTFAAGVLCACLFDLLRASRKVFKQDAYIVGLWDLIFWLASCFICYSVIYHINSGRMRAYQFVAIFIGGLLYFLLLSKPVNIIFVNFFRITRFILKILLTPTVFLYKILLDVLLKTKNFIYMKIGGCNEAINKNKKRKKLKKKL